ncbi:MAG: FliM/FliN family flagellar motor switch protein, partial [SAR324 cluster bacterium]|nr:FliM/FliN family flagellar motor switch protein [SAR324 cluster bacterium]
LEGESLEELRVRVAADEDGGEGMEEIEEIDLCEAEAIEEIDPTEAEAIEEIDPTEAEPLEDLEEAELATERLELPEEAEADQTAFEAAEDVNLDEEPLDLELEDAELEPLEEELEPIELAEEPVMLEPEPVEAIPEDFAAEGIGAAEEVEDSADFMAVEDARVDDDSLMELNLDDVDAAELAQVDEIDAVDQEAYGETAIDPMGYVDISVSEPAAQPEELTMAPIAEAAPATAISKEILLSISHQVSVELGSVTLNGKELMDLTYGSVIPLERVVGEPVDLVLENKTIAQGEVVLINGKNLGVRIVALTQ